MPTNLMRRPTPTAMLARLIEHPDLVRRVRALPSQAFSSLVRQIGVEDAGEIVALSTTEQLVAAFDEDLFVNAKPGEREVFDTRRFAVWLEVLLEAGDDIAARRVAEMSEDFVGLAISNIVMVLDYEALLLRMSTGSHSARSADKALESSLTEEIDGYLLVSKMGEGWDAVMTLILALDRDHRALLVRILDRCAALAGRYVEDLDALTTVLTSEETLIEDVEAERDERRSRQGFVEPRAARAFLELARQPLTAEGASEVRDAITHAYFRDLESATLTAARETGTDRFLELVGAVDDDAAPPLALPMGSDNAETGENTADSYSRFIEAMRLLNESDANRFGERMNELAYLANVLLAGAHVQGRRFRPSEAAETAVATVALGAEFEAGERRLDGERDKKPVTATELSRVLQVCSSDRLFRKASSTLASQGSQYAFVCARPRVPERSG